MHQCTFSIRNLKLLLTPDSHMYVLHKKWLLHTPDAQMYASQKKYIVSAYSGCTDARFPNEYVISAYTGCRDVRFTKETYSFYIPDAPMYVLHKKCAVSAYDGCSDVCFTQEIYSFCTFRMHRCTFYIRNLQFPHTPDAAMCILHKKYEENQR